MRYRIFWNNKQHDFWKYHKQFCEKFGITKDVTVNYTSDVELSDSHIELKCARPMPVYAVPGLIDHF